MESFDLTLPNRPRLPIIGARTSRSHSLGSGGRRFLADVDSSPVSWKKYWTSCQDVKMSVSCDSNGEGSSAEDSFRVYRKGSDGPLLVFLHGGGYSALTWSLVVEEVFSEVPHCQALAYDQRGHGSTRTQNPDNMDADTLARDVGRVLHVVFGSSIPGPVVLVGHSMGGAIAVHTEFKQCLDVAVAGVIVIDVVEGTALAALSAMHSVLAARPSSFPSIQEAVLWSYRSGQTRNLEAARVSMPGQIKNFKTNECAADEVVALEDKSSEAVAPAAPEEGDDEAKEAALGSLCGLNPSTTRFSGRRLSCRRLSVDNENKIEEEEEELTEDNGDKKTIASHEDRRKKLLHNEEFRRSFETKRLKQSSSLATPSSEGPYQWSINLSTTTPHWTGWFEGLSQRFLSISPPKLLLLAGVDRLDTDLTVGQMQGKFQMQVVGRCGHAVHEDAPDEVAGAVLAFLTRHRVLQPKHPTRFQTLPGC